MHVPYLGSSRPIRTLPSSLIFTALVGHQCSAPGIVPESSRLEAEHDYESQDPVQAHRRSRVVGRRKMTGRHPQLAPMNWPEDMFTMEMILQLENASVVEYVFIYMFAKRHHEI